MAGVWFELTSSLLNKSPQPKCKPLQTSSSRFPWQLTYFLDKLIALAIFFFLFIFVLSQTGGFIDFLLAAFD